MVMSGLVAFALGSVVGLIINMTMRPVLPASPDPRTLGRWVLIGMGFSLALGAVFFAFSVYGFNRSIVEWYGGHSLDPQTASGTFVGWGGLVLGWLAIAFAGFLLPVLIRIRHQAD